jgi:uncharacterized hydrophobic protein (TIGR00271 family)
LISRSSLSVRWSSDPSLGPLVALCIGVVTRRRQSATRALGTLVLGFAVGMAATVILTWILTALGLLNESMLIAERPLTSFIWKPDALSWIVGFLAGIAGMLALTSAKSGALVGVLISVTTIPAAANVAVAIAYWVPSEAIGSGYSAGDQLVRHRFRRHAHLAGAQGTGRATRPAGPSAHSLMSSADARSVIFESPKK